MTSQPMAPPDRVLMGLLEARPVIALVGASSRIERPSHTVMRNLLEQRYPVFPVNPNESEVLGLKCYPNLRAIPHRVDLVDVFRRAEAAPEVAREAVMVGAGTLWLQMGVISEEAAEIARAAGLLVVMDRCTWVEHERLVGMPFRGAAPPPQPFSGAGLCADCRHGRRVPTPQTTYWLCRRSGADPGFPKYPALPMRACRGFQWDEGGEPEP